MKKKLVSLLMASAMVLGLAACGNSGSTTSSDNSGSSDSAASDTSTGTGDSAGVFKLGTSGPLTGDAAIYGKAVANGAQIAVDEINAAGGVNGAMLELQAQDDEADGEKAVNAYNTLLDWGMQIMAGPTTTGSSQAVSAVAYDDRTFMMTPSASSVDVIDGKDNVFQVCFTDPNQGTASADYMSQHYADAKIAVIYRNDDAYSQGIHDSFVTEASAEGLDVVYEGTFTKDTATDFSVQLTAAQSAGADLVFLPIYYQPASVIFNQAKAMGYAPTFFGVDGMDGILTLEGFDTSLAEGVMLLTPFSADAQDERTQNFVSAYQSKYGDTPNQFAADSYDVVYTLKAALEAANCTPDMSREDICEALVAVMPTITVDGLTGSGMTWDASGAVSKAPMAVIIENGAYVLPND